MRGGENDFKLLIVGHLLRVVRDHDTVALKTVRAILKAPLLQKKTRTKGKLMQVKFNRHYIG